MKKIKEIWMDDRYKRTCIMAVSFVCILMGIIVLVMIHRNETGNGSEDRKEKASDRQIAEEIKGEVVEESQNQTECIESTENIEITETVTDGETAIESENSQEVMTEIVTEEMTEEMEPATQTPYVYTPQVKNTGDYVIAIDAGHQTSGNYEQEPIGPGAAETKYKVAGGTNGVVTGIPEYELTLEVALKLKGILVERGYQVVMIRESNDVNISNAERAEMANAAGADAFIRIHADASDAESAHGMTALCQTESNPYNGSAAAYSKKLSECVLAAMEAATGARNRGVSQTDSMSGINWAQVPVTIIEMGFMTNREEDEKMATEDYQNRLAEGMADGIDSYFAGLN